MVALAKKLGAVSLLHMMISLLTMHHLLEVSWKPLATVVAFIFFMEDIVSVLNRPQMNESMMLDSINSPLLVAICGVIDTRGSRGGPSSRVFNIYFNYKVPGRMIVFSAGIHPGEPGVEFLS